MIFDILEVLLGLLMICLALMGIGITLAWFVWCIQTGAFDWRRK